MGHDRRPIEPAEPRIDAAGDPNAPHARVYDESSAASVGETPQSRARTEPAAAPPARDNKNTMIGIAIAVVVVLLLLWLIF